jgi:hypothetical protein
MTDRRLAGSRTGYAVALVAEVAWLAFLAWLAWRAAS